MKDWLTASDLIALKLPRLPTARATLYDLIKHERWNNAGADQVRKATDSNRGFEYHISLLPSLAQAKLARIAAEDAHRIAIWRRA